MLQYFNGQVNPARTHARYIIADDLQKSIDQGQNGPLPAEILVTR